MTEHWLPVAGRSGEYEVSDCGRVRSLQRRDSRGRTVNPRILKPQRNTSGHLQVGLATGKRGARLALVHRLVLEAFEGPCPPGMEALHADDDPSNNRRTNLRWGTRSENTIDKVRNGRHNMARRTECPRGHALSGSNLKQRTNGSRECLSCRRTTSLCSKRGVPFDAAMADRKYEEITAATTKGKKK